MKGMPRPPSPSPNGSESEGVQIEHLEGAGVQIEQPSAPLLSVIPPLSPAAEAALEHDIVESAFLAPVVVDQNGQVIDGRARRSIAARRGLTVPTISYTSTTPMDRDVLALRLNYGDRRTQAERRESIRRLRAAYPEVSLRQIARWVGVSPATVLTVVRAMEAELAETATVATAPETDRVVIEAVVPTSAPETPDGLHPVRWAMAHVIPLAAVVATLVAAVLTGWLAGWW